MIIFGIKEQKFIPFHSFRNRTEIYSFQLYTETYLHGRKCLPEREWHDCLWGESTSVFIALNITSGSDVSYLRMPSVSDGSFHGDLSQYKKFNILDFPTT